MDTADKLDEGREPSKTFALGNGVNANGSVLSVSRHLHSKQEVALAVGVSPRTVDNWMAQKRIPFIRLSARLIRFDLERVKTALARYEIKEVGARR
jgi:excisionase family DNA binding protein